jgi:hypothetical protein
MAEEKTISPRETVHVKLVRETYERIRKIANAESRTINNTVRVLLSEALKAREDQA